MAKDKQEATSVVSPEQRRLNLMLALSATRRRLTREEIYERVDGYKKPAANATDEERERASVAFQRLFERDKDELRSMGLPLKTVVDPIDQGDLGYRIDGDSAMPDIDLSVHDAAILALAVEYWQGASLAADARTGFAKVMSAIERTDSEELPYGGMATTAGHDTTAILTEAIVDQQRVRFEYASASSKTAKRTVEPWRIVMRGGVEYLIGRDVDREDQRTYRLGRIVGKVKAIGAEDAFERPEHIDLGDLDDSGPARIAVIGLRPESGDQLRRNSTPTGERDGWELFTVPYRHEDLLRAEVLSLQGNARVFEPESLAESVVAHTRAAQEVTREGNIA